MKSGVDYAMSVEKCNAIQTKREIIAKFSGSELLPNMSSKSLKAFSLLFNAFFMLQISFLCH